MTFVLGSSLDLACTVPSQKYLKKRYFNVDTLFFQHNVEGYLKYPKITLHLVLYL